MPTPVRWAFVIAGVKEASGLCGPDGAPLEGEQITFLVQQSSAAGPGKPILFASPDINEVRDWIEQQEAAHGYSLPPNAVLSPGQLCAHLDFWAQQKIPEQEQALLKEASKLCTHLEREYEKLQEHVAKQRQAAQESAKGGNN
jgi:hypothetical protein